MGADSRLSSMRVKRSRVPPLRHGEARFTASAGHGVPGDGLCYPGVRMGLVTPLADEARVVARAQKGERSAFEILYRVYAPVLFSHVLVPMLGDRDDAHDCLRDTFLAAHRALPEFVWREAGIFPWLRMLARNKARDHLRAAGRRQRLRGAYAHELEALGGQVETLQELDLQRTRLRAQIEGVLKTMTPRYATVLRLRLLEERSREECAAALEIKLGTLDVLFFRACRAFQKACKEHDDALRGDLRGMVP